MSEPRVVVGAAVLDGAGRLLAARRSAPPALAGRWELPGGKVEDGEADQAALVRELREELTVEVRLGARVGGDWPMPGGAAVLRVWVAEVVTGEPVPVSDHDALRWVEPADWPAVDWLDADRPVVELLARAPCSG
jgi:8-oxo-dGTP diphosphatase